MSREVAGPLDGASELLREQAEAAYWGWTDEECLWRRRSRTAVAGANNLTRALSATDTSPGDLTGLPCTTGYCHLEGPRVSDSDAHGAGLVKVASP